MDNLILDISNCDEITQAFKDSNHPCHEIIMAQSTDKVHFQHPEPWNGNIKKASILFISSNPSYNPSEDYPNDSWKNNEIIDFHENRFSDQYYLKNKKKVKFWNCTRKVASWILNKDLNDTLLESFICMTEVVHCKSKNEIGVDSACKKCVKKWFEKVISEYDGTNIVVFGTTAKKQIEEYDLSAFFGSKKVYYAPHPSSWSYKGTDEIIRRSFFSD